MAKFLDSIGLSKLLQKLKNVFATKTELSAFVTKNEDEVISGQKTIQMPADSGHTMLVVRSGVLDKDITPSSNKYVVGMSLCDKSTPEFDREITHKNGRYGVIEAEITPQNDVKMYMAAYGGGSDNFNYQTIGVGYDASGNAYSWAPETLLTRMGDRDILTRSWIPKDERIVHTTGNETIAGVKTFTEPINGDISAYKVQNTENGSSANWIPLAFRGLVDNARACKTVFAPASAVTVEYCTDGSTWTDYGASDADKQKLFAMTRSVSFQLGKGTAGGTSEMSTGCKLRVTVAPTDRYAAVDVLYLWVCAYNHTMKVDVERSTIGNKTTFTKIREGVAISGWAGANVVSFPSGQYGGGANQTGNYYAYRFTFYCTGISSNKTYYPYVQDIRLYGQQVWNSANSMMLNDHLYSWDENQNAFFPAEISATQLNLGATGKIRCTTQYTASTATCTSDLITFNTSNNEYGNNVSFGGSGNTIVGAGESYSAQLNALLGNGSEDLYLCADGSIYFKSNCNTFANAKTITLNTSGELSGLAKVTATSFVGALTGNASTATSANSLLTLAATALPTGNLSVDGMQAVAVYNNGYPCNYGNVINVQSSNKGAGQLLLGWSGATNGIEHIYYRNKRDNQTTWSDWKTVAFTSDSITGNAATATKLASATTINGVSFDGSAAITVADSTKVAKAGDTMTGALTINRSNSSAGGGIKLTGSGQNYAISILDTSVTKGTAPSATKYWGIEFYGKDASNYNQRIAMIDANLTSGNISSCYLRAYNCTTNTNTGTCAIGASVDASGNGYTYAPTPAVADSSTKIATTAWARTATGNFACNSATATKLATTRSISLGGFMTGSANFDGSANITITATHRSCLVGQSGSTTTNPWYKFASFTVNTTNDDIEAVFLVDSTYASHWSGILRVHVRTNSDKTITAGNCTLAWLVHTGFTPADFVMVIPSTASGTVELWTKIATAWRFVRFTVLSEGSRTTTNARWTLYNASSAGQQASIPTAGTQKESVVAGAVNTAVSTTSDARLKKDVQHVPSNVIEAWRNIDWQQFRFKNGIEGDSESSRLHVGLVAQEVESVFVNSQLNPYAYGILHRNEDDGMYSINYLEALMMEAIATRNENSILKSRISTLENQIAQILNQR